MALGARLLGVDVDDPDCVVVGVTHEELSRHRREGEAERVRKGGGLCAAVDEAALERACEGAHLSALELELSDQVVGRV